MTLIGESEGVSVSQMRGRLRAELGVGYPRREVRDALVRLCACGILACRARGGVRGARVLYWRERRRRHAG